MIVTTVETIVRKWKVICGVVTATAAVGAIVWGIFYYEANNAATLHAHSDSINTLTSKVDKISNDTSEMKGKLDVVISLLQGQNGSKYSRVAQR